jgi:hypothetical protein
MLAQMVGEDQSPASKPATQLAEHVLGAYVGGLD